MPHRPARPLPLAVALLAVAALLAASSPRAAASHEVVAARAAGVDRFETAAILSRLAHPAGATTAIVARADDFPDALAAAGLAGRLGAPVLLTRGDRLDPRTRAELDRLGVRDVVLLGGLSAISAAASHELEGRYRVRRVAGPSRFATAADAARVTAESGPLGTTDGLVTAFVVSGVSFPDALAAGAVAAAETGPIPIVLTLPDRLPSETAAVLDELGVQRALVVGGQAAVGSQVAADLRANGQSVLRLAGPDRTATAVVVADFARRHLGVVAVPVLARGDDFPDALAAGPAAARLGGPVLLTPSPTQLGEQAHAWLSRACPDVQVVQAAGGTGALSAEVLDVAVAAAATCEHTDGGGQTYVVDPRRVRTDIAGTAFAFRTDRRTDGQPLTGPLDVALLPCRAVDATGDPVAFADADGDGRADGLGSSDTGAARITAVHGQPVREVHVRGEQPVDGALSFTVAADADDCAVAVVFSDADGDGRLRVAAPAEPLGIAQVRWRGTP